MDNLHSLGLQRVTGSGIFEFGFQPRRLIIAGWTGRDHQSLEAHLEELEAIGIPRPVSTPVFYQVSESRLTTMSSIQVVGQNTSGEAECVLLRDGESWLVGVGSDHADRTIAADSVHISKQVCDKPVGREFWPVDEVVNHWDSLILRSYVTADGQTDLYQEGTVDTLLSAPELMQKFDEASDLALCAGDVLFGGTVSVMGDIRGGQQFAFELEDPVLGRAIAHRYQVQVIDSGDVQAVQP